MKRPALAGVVPAGAGAARVVVLAAALLWAVVLSLVVDLRYGGDARGLLCVGQEAHHPPAFDASPTSGRWGYDGQYYATLATDPFLRRPDTLRSLDAPSYRATRIAVPLLAWTLALGEPRAALAVYQLLCWGFALAAVFLVARWLAADGASPWWALLLPAGAGLCAVMLRSTPDGAAVFFVLAALRLHALRRDRAALILACAAVLSRETSYLVALVLAVDQLRNRRFASAAGLVSIPLALLAGWKLYLSGMAGAPLAAGAGNFSVPFVWLKQTLPVVFQGGHVFWRELFGLGAIGATVVSLAVVATTPSPRAAPELAFLAFGGLSLFLSYAVYCETWAYARVLLVLPFLAVLIAARQTTGLRRWAIRSVAIFYFVSGAATVRGELRSALAILSRTDARDMPPSGPRTVPLP